MGRIKLGKSTNSSGEWLLNATIRVDAQEHACPARNLEVSAVRSQDDEADWVGSASVRDAYVLEAVGPASIGGEYPQRLGTVITVDGASTLCTIPSSGLA